MTLDVEIPEPPTLHGGQDPGDYDAVDEPEPEDWTGDTAPREALAEFLREGAWEDAFAEWSDQTYMTEGEFRLVLELGLIDEFDFYWNESAEDVGYRASSVPGTLPESYDESLDSGDVQGIEEELDGLGRTVSEVLENDYIHRDGDEFGFFGDR